MLDSLVAQASKGQLETRQMMDPPSPDGTYWYARRGG